MRAEATRGEIPALMRALWLGLAFQLAFPNPVGYVNDFARIIDPAHAAAMTRLIEEVRQKSGGEIVVVTLSDLKGRAPIDVARDIGRAWKVGAQGGPGNRARNAGVVLLLKPGARPGDGKAQIAIATGSGAEGFVTDALSGRVRDAIGREAVASGSYAAGLEAGVGLLAEAYAREFGFSLEGGGAAPARAPEQRVAPEFSPLWEPFGWLLIVIIVLTALATNRRRGGGGGSSFWGSFLSGGGGGGGGGGSWGGGGFGGGGFAGFGGGGGFSGGGASGSF